MRQDEPRIAIIGAGVAGLGAAYYLQDRGYSRFTVFEKADRVGGKCFTIKYHGRCYDMGGDFFTPEYKLLLKLVREQGLTLRHTPNRHSLDIQTGKYHWTITSVTEGESKIGILLGSIRYMLALWKYRAIRKPGYRNVPEEICIPFLEWIDNNGMGALRKIFIIPLNIFGYADKADDLPAATVLKFIDFPNLVMLAKIGLGLAWFWPKHLDIGTQGLWERVSRFWDVRLNTQIDQIKRDDKVRIWMNGNEEPEVFDKLILAAPFDESVAYVDHHDHAKELFGKIIYNEYYSTAQIMDVVPNGLQAKGTIDELPLPPAGHPWALIRAWMDRDLLLGFSLSQADIPLDQFGKGPINAPEVDAFIEHDIGVAGGVLAEGPPFQQNQWRYYPHVTSREMGEGRFYDKLEGLQGEHHTYYTWSLMNFETMHNTMQYSKTLIEQEFEDRRAMKPGRDDRICIVGAGPAGLSAAWYLKERGYRNVRVLEKANHVGGKCHTLEVDGKPIEMGAFTVTWGYRHTLAIAKSVGAALIPQPERKTFSLIPPSVQSIRAALLAEYNIVRLGWTILYYFLALIWHRRAVKRPGFVGIKSEKKLVSSFYEWTDTWSKRPLRTLMRVPVKDMGYGDYRHIPTFYVLKYVGISNFLTLVLYALGLIRKWPKRFLHGFQNLWERVREGLPTGTVETSVDICSIERNGNTISVDVGEKTPRTYDWLILACPLEQMLGVLDCTKAERMLLEAIRYQDYDVAVYDTEGFDHEIVDAIKNLETDHPWEMMRAWADVSACTYYTFATDGAPPEKRHAAIEEDVKALFNGQVGAKLGEKRWSYFPKYDGQAIEAGYFDELARLQGTRGTFWAGSLLGFETVETTVSYSRSLIRRWFP